MYVYVHWVLIQAVPFAFFIDLALFAKRWAGLQKGVSLFYISHRLFDVLAHIIRVRVSRHQLFIINYSLLINQFLVRHVGFVIQ